MISTFFIPICVFQIYYEVLILRSEKNFKVTSAFTMCFFPLISQYYMRLKI